MKTTVKTQTRLTDIKKVIKKLNTYKKHTELEYRRKERIAKAVKFYLKNGDFEIRINGNWSSPFPKNKKSFLIGGTTNITGKTAWKMWISK